MPPDVSSAGNTSLAVAIFTRVFGIDRVHVVSACHRHPRVPYEGFVSISWKTFEGVRNCALGKCLDVSERGVGLELSSRIAVGSFVKVRAYGLNLEGSAFVRHVSRQAGKYILGLELSAPLDSDVLEDPCASGAEAELPHTRSFAFSSNV